MVELTNRTSFRVEQNEAYATLTEYFWPDTNPNFNTRGSRVYGPQYGYNDFKIHPDFDYVTCNPYYTYGSTKFENPHRNNKMKGQLCGTWTGGAQQGLVAFEAWIINKPLVELLEKDEQEWLSEQLGVKVGGKHGKQRSCYSTATVTERSVDGLVQACKTRAHDEDLVMIAITTSGQKIVAQAGPTALVPPTNKVTRGFSVLDRGARLMEVTGRRVHTQRAFSRVGVDSYGNLQFGQFSSASYADFALNPSMGSGTCKLGSFFGNYTSGDATLDAREAFCGQRDGAGFGVTVLEAWLVKRPDVAPITDAEEAWLSDAMHGGAPMDFKKSCYDSQTDADTGEFPPTNINTNYLKTRLHEKCNSLKHNEMLVAVAVLSTGRKLAINLYQPFGKKYTKQDKDGKKRKLNMVKDRNAAVFELTQGLTFRPTGYSDSYIFNYESEVRVVHQADIRLTPC